MTAQTPAVPGRPAAESVDERAVGSASSSVTGMTLFVASEAVFFAAFLGIYANSYTAADNWPPPGMPAPSLVVPSVALVILLLSGVAMTRCLRRMHQAAYPAGLAPWLLTVFAGSVLFSALVAVTMTGTGFGIGDGIYQSLYFVMTGLELAHGIGGAVLLGLLLVRLRTGELALRRDPLQAAAIYWYFVIVLGVVLYAVLDLAVQ
ncbi:MAG TPA: cytochrome c oxidase subunit 3 [Nocardioides sp.]|uniref:cytochrome c oxidase subunit 3 n=1 Tax=Nocardioides sp. TaxID=35761 RepID=UPI002F419198